MEISIIVAEGQPILREGLVAGLAESGRFHVVAEAATVPELRAAFQAHPGSVAVVDLDLPGGTSSQVIEESVAAGWGRTVALSASNARVHLEGSMRAGATGYVVKTSTLEELAQALHEVAAGRSYVSRAASHHLVDVVHEGGRRTSDSLFDLTRRERQVLEGIVSGHSCPELAEELGISARTVERHRASVMSKLDIHKTAKLVRFAVREGLVAA